jgi:enoyl-CoA hydratase/carnithine racemase
MDSDELIIRKQEEPIGALFLNRPERRNALSLELLECLFEHLEQIASASDVSVLILGAHGRDFSSGHDLNELVGGALQSHRQLFHTCTRVMERIQSLPQPVIAMVQGTATAAGCQLVATCDLVVAAEGAKFATPGVRIGYFCSTPGVAVSRSVGRKKALEMLLTGEPITAHEALSHGLVNCVVPDDALTEETWNLARKIARTPLPVIAGGKRAFYHQVEQSQEAAYRYAQEIMAVTALAEEAQEGIKAFLGKRRPNWLKD